ncbi:hypothetical protein DACRYDRAFT_59472 [Dacryopinax primogenitus]|uniref:DUF202 domain-containing protein n=1 Tax=Dacryopinax primogenitus (strain DJM 731) TaxID=1858805 RepID=M5FQY9_DACPD|nr:uncharacterized protein DACRYDRAFT_59472 [Dacryopinax primogenitus]EJT97214.1 hypothetical protein DACRYDRAFT_59472 [Dacryopinax primogenitus]
MPVPSSSPRLQTHQSHPRHTYNAHRASSFLVTDPREEDEIRARLRTFEGAYSRTAMATLGYSVLILKLFNREFYRIGLLYVILSLLLLLVEFQRRRHARHQFADEDTTPPPPGSRQHPENPQSCPQQRRDAGETSHSVSVRLRILSGLPESSVAFSSLPEPTRPITSNYPPIRRLSLRSGSRLNERRERVWGGREFKTPGWIVVLVTGIVGIVEVTLFAFVCAL